MNEWNRTEIAANMWRIAVFSFGLGVMFKTAWGDEIQFRRGYLQAEQEIYTWELLHEGKYWKDAWKEQEKMQKK